MQLNVNGKDIEISSEAVVTVEVGRYRNAYKVRNTFSGAEATQAVLIFDGLNIGNGYKARLRIDGVTVAVKRDVQHNHNAPPSDAATATGMYDAL